MSTKNSAATAQVATVSTKKDKVISLYRSGITDVSIIANIIGSKASYVASILQNAGIKTGYTDLFSSAQNVYSKLFEHKLGFKDNPTAQSSVVVLEGAYKGFEQVNDSVGIHHTLSMGLTMYSRAICTGKEEQAKIFAKWLKTKLT